MVLDIVLFFSFSQSVATELVPGISLLRGIILVVSRDLRCTQINCIFPNFYNLTITNNIQPFLLWSLVSRVLHGKHVVSVSQAERYTAKRCSRGVASCGPKKTPPESKKVPAPAGATRSCWSRQSRTPFRKRGFPNSAAYRHGCTRGHLLLFFQDTPFLLVQFTLSH